VALAATAPRAAPQLLAYCGAMVAGMALDCAACGAAAGAPAKARKAT
jgi:hypothetical protein